MPEIPVLMTYLVVLLGFVFFPGPSILLTLARATTCGTRVGLATSLGIGLGDLIHTLLAVAGVSAVVMASAQAFFVIKLVGAAYLVWIGIRTILDGHGTTGQSDMPPVTPGEAFRQACLAEVLNPKSAVFFLAFLPQFVSPERGAIASQLLILGLIFVIVGTSATVLVAFCAGGIGRILRLHPAIRCWQGRVVGGLYCALGIRLAFQER